MKSDLQIAQEAKLKPITEIAESIGIKEDELDLYGSIVRDLEGEYPTFDDVLKYFQDKRSKTPKDSTEYQKFTDIYNYVLKRKIDYETGSFSAIIPRLDWDSRDDPFQPGHGVYSSVQFKLARPFIGDVLFFCGESGRR